MFNKIKEFFFGKPNEVASAQGAKVEAVNAAPYKVEPPVTPIAETVKPAKAKAPAKKRTFVKREDKPAAAIKAPAKPKAPRKPKAK